MSQAEAHPSQEECEYTLPEKIRQGYHYPHGQALHNSVSPAYPTNHRMDRGTVV